MGDHCWNSISYEAINMIQSLLQVNPNVRLNAADALNKHPWMTNMGMMKTMQQQEHQQHHQQGHHHHHHEHHHQQHQHNNRHHHRQYCYNDTNNDIDNNNMCFITSSPTSVISTGMETHNEDLINSGIYAPQLLFKTSKTGGQTTMKGTHNGGSSSSTIQKRQHHRRRFNTVIVRRLSSESE